MRGRSLIREASGPSLCAFCAHRLGQARKPSHLQRRFLHSTRATPNSQAEAAASPDGDDKTSLQSSWGRPKGSGSTPSWSRPAFGGIQGAKSNTVPVDRTPIGSTVPKAAETTHDGDDDLLPHERRARDKLRIRRQEAQAVASRPRGAPPPMDRGGRPIPYTAEDRARNSTFIESDRSYNKENERGPQITRPRMQFSPEAPFSREAPEGKSVFRHIRNHPETQNKSWNNVPRPTIIASASRNYDHGPQVAVADVTPSWGNQLRIRRTGYTGETQTQPDSRYTEDRTAREEVSRSGQYTPLGGRLRSSGGSPESYRRTPEADTRRETVADQRPPPPTGPKRQTTWDDLPRRPFENAPGPAVEGGERPVAAYSPMPAQERYPPRPSYESQRVGEEFSIRNIGRAIADLELQEEGGRRKKERKRRGRDDDYEESQTMMRGKERDKAKRRQQFIKTEEEDAEAIAVAEEKAQRQREKVERKAAQAAAHTRIFLPQFITVANLATALRVKFETLTYKMEEMGFDENNWAHDFILGSEDSSLIALEYKFDPIFERGEEEDLKPRDPPADPSVLPPRPPVVTIMGHVDHGKTTLLDYLRKSSVAATEHGGITQHIGAFSVPMPSGKVITFLDTPGHAAFLSMRQRGANVTDIVILVVAADDSVKPQTIEAINHAKAAKVPMIVAINKIDKPDVDIEKVKTDLARHGVEIEDFGGDTQVVLVSGKTGKGMDDLEEAAVTLSEILDARAETDGPVEGWVLEASIKAVGKVATVLVRRGTIHPGDVVVAGNTWAKVRVLRNEAGVEVSEAGPGMPVQVDGWREQPIAGDTVLQAPDEGKAKHVVDYRLEKIELEKLAEDMEAINAHRKIDQARQKREKEEAALAKAAKRAGEEVFRSTETAEAKPTGPKQIYFIVKADVSGSLEAVVDSLAAVGNKEVEPHVLRSGVGQVSEFDIEHAAAAKGCVINFNTTVEPHIMRLAEESKVKIIEHKIIYALVDDIKAELSKHLSPLVIQKVLGEAEIAQVFKINIKGRVYKPVAGCKIRNGSITRNSKIRVLRRGEKVFDGEMSSLKNQKRDVTEMSKGGECGIGFQDWFDFQVGDQIQTYEEKFEKRYL